MKNYIDAIIAAVNDNELYRLRHISRAVILDMDITTEETKFLMDFAEAQL